MYIILIISKCINNPQISMKNKLKIFASGSKSILYHGQIWGYHMIMQNYSGFLLRNAISSYQFTKVPTLLKNWI